MAKPPSSSNGSRRPLNVWPITTRPRKPRASAVQRRSVPPRTAAKSGKSKNSAKRSAPRDRRSELLKRLGLTSLQVDLCPKIAPLLRQCGISAQRVMEVLSADTEPDSAKVCQLWDGLRPVDRGVLGMEGLALAAGLSPRRLWELYNGANLMQSRESIGAMIANSLPTIMARTIKEAKTVKGHAAREHIYKASRILPTPKGTIINLPGSGSQKELEDGDDEDDSAGDLEGADDFLLRASKAMGAKALPAPTAEVLEPDDDEDEEE